MTARAALARVASLHRFPVKSVSGQEVTHLDLDARGVTGDRLWAVRTADGKIGSGKATRRFAAIPGLLTLRAEQHGDQVVITLPDGSRCNPEDPLAGELLSRHLGQPVTLAQETGTSHFDDGPVSLLGLASVQAVAAERAEHVAPVRFRANIVLQTEVPFVEEQWLGQELALGTAVVLVVEASLRCVMVNAETVALPAQSGVLSAVGRVNEARLGVLASVVTPGRVAVGDVLRAP